MARRCRKYEPSIDELRAVVRWKYYKENKSITDISKEVGKSLHFVSKWLKRDSNIRKKSKRKLKYNKDLMDFIVRNSKNILQRPGLMHLQGE